MGERRAPGVQHGGDAYPGAEAPGIGGDGERRLGRRLHQQVVDHALVLVGDVAQLARQRVDDVKVWDGQQLRFAVGQPSARRRSLAEPWPTALSRRRLLSVSLRLPVARRAQARERALDLGDESCRHAGVARHQAIPAARIAQGLPSHPPLRAPGQRQPRREHRNGPRTARRRPACCRGAKAAGYPTGRAACAALPMPALRRPHDCDRGLRARLRANVAADPKQDRHIMSQTACERRHVLAPMRWLHAGGDLSRHNHANQPADRPLIRSTRPPRLPIARFQVPPPHPSRSPGASFAPTIMAGAKIKSP